MGPFSSKRKDDATYINRKLSEYWKLEIFYYNKEDKNIIVSSRYGIGFAFNYGHIAVKIALGTIAAVLLALIVIVFVK